MIDALRRFKHWLETLWEKFQLRGIYRGGGTDVDLNRHITEAANWIRRAQDFGEDRGVSYGARFGGGFLDSYPETTGYIIPTMLRLAKYTGDSEYRQRALEMGHWEADIQMRSGAVMGGMVNPHPTPAVFNTGQVLLGWADLVFECGDDVSRHAGRRAAEWMVGVQEENGQWVKDNSKFASPLATTYNVRAAWGLGKFGAVIGEPKYRRAALRNAEFTLSRQTANGWFQECCLSSPDQPLLHTLAYTARGLFEIGVLEEREDLIDRARLAADAILEQMRPDGFIPGRFHSDWSGASRFSCLTGSAQIAIVWAKLLGQLGDERYREGVFRANGYLMRQHDIISSHDTIRGGLAGSWPTHGGYGQFMVLNWATKFLIDSLLEESQLRGES